MVLMTASKMTTYYFEQAKNLIVILLTVEKSRFMVVIMINFFILQLISIDFHIQYIRLFLILN